MAIARLAPSIRNENGSVLGNAHPNYGGRRARGDVMLGFSGLLDTLLADGVSRASFYSRLNVALILA